MRPRHRPFVGQQRRPPWYLDTRSLFVLPIGNRCRGDPRSMLFERILQITEQRYVKEDDISLALFAHLNLPQISMAMAVGR